MKSVKFVRLRFINRTYGPWVNQFEVSAKRKLMVFYQR
ncbi:hypothetical protein [Methylomonas albis]|nr:hypothetical protein [Methylomonas albis]